MRADLEPLLARQREIYDLPMGRDRFRHYLEVMLAGTRDMALPLALMNPMGKPHVAALLDRLLEIGAEDVAARTLSEASERLAAVALDSSIKFGLVVADDARGGWTNRFTTEMAHRFGRSGELNRDWVVGVLWTSQPPVIETIRYEVLSALYRALHRRIHGNAETLRAMLSQEGRAAAFAASAPLPSDPELVSARERIGEHLASTAFPIQFACLYGDEIAESLGYRALGLPPYAGYRIAAEDAAGASPTPEAALA